LIAGSNGSAAAIAGVTGGGSGAEARLRELGIRLPRVDAAQQSSIVPAVEVGNLLFVSGHGPRGEDGQYVTGKVGADLTVDQGNAAARAAALTLLAAVRNQLGSLDRVTRVVKALGMVNSAPDFTQQPRVVNGFSDTLIEIFGDRGRGARSAVGVASLPNNWAVEVEVILELTPA
jgi:enamine deaminase RidA (YjgF/YER057c/UK114 family)